MIYFIQDSGTLNIKIGYTATSAGCRLSQLQTGCAAPLALLGVIQGEPIDERNLHVRFAQDRVGGEWFKPSTAILQLIIGAARSGAEVNAGLQPQPPDELSVRLLTDAKELLADVACVCEKAFRRGFQHGFNVARDGAVAEDRVRTWRHRGDLYKSTVPPGGISAPMPSARRLCVEAGEFFDGPLGDLIHLAGEVAP